ncbi:MAG: polyamine aminopropyltransferase [Deltaproteobacteria bacterium]|jgi:spermidine synthase|nr:polyamine aminopropyltransferase [Deltaproteobacteria bacterium]
MLKSSSSLKSNPKFLSLILGLSMLFVGICGISYEYTFSKLASDILGDSVKQWAIIIGLMMFFMGVGADLQKYFPDELNVDNFIILEVILGLLGGLGPTITLFAFGALHSHFILVHYFFICAIGLLIGLEIPLLTRVNQKTLPSLKHNLGMILKMDYIGSFIGALVWIFVLPRFFNLLEISFFLGIINVVVALFTWYWFRDWMKYPVLVPIIAIGVIIILIVGIINGEKLAITAEQKLYKDPIVFTKTTPYQRIILTESQTGNLYCYINGNLQFASLDEHIYHEFLVHPVLATAHSRKNILVLGGGDGLAVREILKYKDVQSVTLVDIDPEMTDLARNYPRLRELNQNSLNTGKVKIVKPEGITKGEKVKLDQIGKGFFRRQHHFDEVELNIINLDAFQFVKSIQGIFDIIVIDFPDPNSLTLSKLYSKEFYGLLKNKLAFEGLIIQQSSSPTFAREAFLIIGRTYQSAGFSTVPIHHTVPSFGDWGWWVSGHEERFSATALKHKLENISNLPTTVNYITKELVQGSLFFGKGQLETDQTDINKILDDRVFRHYLKAWKQFQ